MEKGKIVRRAALLFMLLSVLPFLIFASDEALAAETGNGDLVIMVKPPGTIRLAFSPEDPSQQADVPDITSLSLTLRMEPADGLFGRMWVYRDVTGFSSAYSVRLTKLTPFMISGNPGEGELDSIPYGLFFDGSADPSVTFSVDEKDEKTVDIELFSSKNQKVWYRKVEIASTLPEGFKYDSSYTGRLTFTVTIEE